MEAAAVARVRGWLDASAATAVVPRVVEHVRRALASDTAPVAVGAHGSAACFVALPAGRRRVLELDRRGTLLSALVWDDDGRLREAAIRLPDGRWILIDPARTPVAPWGDCDRLWRVREPRLDRETAEPLTVFTSLDYGDVHEIPTLAEPARLPAGAGATVLNLLASLARDQDRTALAYRGPYPTERLFLTLLECFRCAGARDPLSAFMAGDLDWTPAPHERLFARDGVYVQLRERVEKVVWDGRTYHRPDWHGIAWHAPRRVRDVGGRVRCSLWTLGAAVEDHLELMPDGDVVRVVRAPPPLDATRDIAPEVRAGLAAAVAASSAAPLASAVLAAASDVRLAWAPVDRDLLAIERDHVRFSHALRTIAAARVGRAETRRDRIAVGFAVLGEMAALLGDELRARAQASIAALPLAEQTALLERQDAPPADTATAIGRAVEALLADLQSDDGVDSGTP